MVLIRVKPGVRWLLARGNIRPELLIQLFSLK